MSNQPTVLHLLSPKIGWEESWFVLSLAAKMTCQGIDVSVAGPEDSWASKNAEAMQARFIPLKLANYFNPMDWVRLSSLVKKSEIGVVHAHDKVAASVLGYSWLPRSCGKVVSWYRKLSADCEGSFVKSDCVFVASQFSGGSRLASDGKCKAVVAYCGSDSDKAGKAAASRDSERAALREKFCPGKDKPLFIFYSAPFEKEGRHQKLIEAMPDLLARLPQVHLLLSGDGSLFADLERQTRITALENDVTFLEPDPDFPSLMNSVDLYVSPRQDDAVGIMTQAAMAAGRAVLADASGIGAELIDDGKTGMLIPAGGSATLAETILELLQNRNHREHLGRMAAAKAAKQFNLSSAMEIMLAAYQSQKS